MNTRNLDGLSAQIRTLNAVGSVGRVSGVDGGVVKVVGLGMVARIGDQIRLERRNMSCLRGEIVQLNGQDVVVLAESSPDGVSLNDRVSLLEHTDLAPSDNWIGRVIDPFGLPLDGSPLLRGTQARSPRAAPPSAASRRGLGARMNTGMAALNTLLPIVRGQRVGLFAGSGVGKSSLLGHLARHMQSDVVVIAMVGERGRELRSFIEDVLGPEGMARSIIVAATSDQSPLIRRRCAWSAMNVAEHFRDQGRNVLFLADSVTRFAEAHREVAVAAGEAPVLRGYPPSTAHMIMSLCERAGPGSEDQGDITALFSVLVAGSDMEEPIADILRGVLDGHIVMDRAIAERGRYPAIDLLRSVSRSLPAAANEKENDLISEVRTLLGAYDQNAMMIKAGLYVDGSDPQLDRAIGLWPELDAFLAKTEGQNIEDSFAKLGVILRRGRSGIKALGTHAIESI
ncbi:MAG: FliI/YscN family ATPase [Paracoccaceae bacterium]